MGAIWTPLYKLNKRDTIMDFTKYEKITAKLAWKYTTDPITIEDLMSIGKVEFYLSIADYDPTKKTAFQTYFYIRARNAMVNYIKDHSRHIQHTNIEDNDIVSETDRVLFLDSIKTLSKESQEIIKIILDNPNQVLENAKFLSPKHLRGAVASVLTSLGWNKPYIYRSFKEIRTFVSQAAQ